MCRGRVIAEADASKTLGTIMRTPIARSSHRPLTARAWQLRHAISAYDALYVALAETLGVPLVTCDAKLAGSNGHRAEIELYPRR